MAVRVAGAEAGAAEPFQVHSPTSPPQGQLLVAFSPQAFGGGNTFAFTDGASALVLCRNSARRFRHTLGLFRLGACEKKRRAD